MDSHAAIAQKLIAQLAKVSGSEVTALSRETALDEIGLDSTLLALTLRAIELEFALEFDDGEIAAFLGAASVGDYIDILHGAVDSRSGLEAQVR